MQLRDLLPSLVLDAATGAIVASRVVIDSRTCAPGDLFVALSGTTTDGTAFVSEAVARGAVAVVATRFVDATVPVLVVSPDDVRSVLAEAARRIAGGPDEGLQLVGVTGTNGKTSVATLVAALVRALGGNAASMGTLTNVRTTPAAPELWQTLRALRDSFGRDKSGVVALEVSSHALDQGRVVGVPFSVVAFTNLSHDHLDYHVTMEDYFAAKASLFTAAYAPRGVIWGDDLYGARLADMTELPVTLVHRSDASALTMSLRGTSFTWRGHRTTSRLVGDYNVDNMLMALAIVSNLGFEDAAVAAAASAVEAVPGRFEVVASDGPSVIVDYAHTPDGLDRLLRAVRAMHEGRIITVFGCGGDRDRAKRPVMGDIATRLSDATIVTSDNPRHEDPTAIIDDIVAGCVCGAYERIIDRRDAIARALRVAGESDVVVIAGKGHETTQTIGDQVLAFDDRTVARELLK